MILISRVKDRLPGLPVLVKVLGITLGMALFITAGLLWQIHRPYYQLERQEVKEHALFMAEVVALSAAPMVRAGHRDELQQLLEQMGKITVDTPLTAVTITINGKPYRVPHGCTAAAAMLLAGTTPTRTTPVSGVPRAPYCMMGVCFECLVEIDGVANQQACLIPVTDGMRINRQLGAVAAKT